MSPLHGEHELASLLETARDRAVEGRHAEASETYLVAADLAEELNDKAVARAARSSARRNHVVIWARRRWPADNVQGEDVLIDRSWIGHTHNRELVRFAVRRVTRPMNRRTGAPARVGWTIVQVDRLGRVRVVGER